jgi:general L-amino acid transport system permease protein
VVAAGAMLERPRLRRGRRWTREHLFSNRWNTALTVVTVAFAIFVALSLLRFVFSSADWTVVEVNLRLLMLGRYPQSEEWRLWPPLWAIFTLGGASFGFWLPIGRRGALAAALPVVFVFGFLARGENALLLLAAAALAVASYALAHLVLRERGAGAYVRRAVIVGWILTLPAAVVLLNAGAEGVSTRLWGGLMLNLMLGAVGIAFGFPLGVLLALGRASSYPVISWSCTAWIEFVRAGPLIAWIFAALFVLPSFLPPIFGIDELDIVARAMLVLGGFTAAYVAEIVRGGLQSLPPGQAEAAFAVGLNSLQTTIFIVLPQAIRAVLPALVGQFIALWKDTTLVSTIGLIELLRAGRATSAQTEFIDNQAEVLLFVAVVFWAVSLSMSRLSARLERGLGVGER